MQVNYLWFTVFILFFLLAEANADSFVNPSNDRVSFTDKINRDWIHNDYWFDGTAEVNHYNSFIIKYGKSRPAEQLVHILVTEKHKPESLVKAENWRQNGLIDMLKFNYLTTVQTGIYSSREMMSVFFKQQNLQLVKMSFTSQDWCGHSFKELVNFRGKSFFRYNTYWDEQGDGEYKVQFPENMILYDALPVQLRMIDLNEKQKININLLHSQISSKVQKPQIENAVVEMGENEIISIPAGNFSANYLRVAHGKGVDEFWLEKKFPHRMLRWHAFNGNTFELLKSDKLAYWQLTTPGDEKYLP